MSWKERSELRARRSLLEPTYLGSMEQDASGQWGFRFARQPLSRAESKARHDLVVDLGNMLEGKAGHTR